MPKYIKNHRGRPPKEHKVINNIKHKQCSSCNKWTILNQFGKCGNGKRSHCKPCVNRKQKQRNKVALEKRKKEREAARGTGFLVCLFVGCTVKQWLQPVDQFISDYEHIGEPTKHCLPCRNKQKEAQKRMEAPCQKVWNDWRIIHPCVTCSQDPNYVHNPLLIEADHLPEFEKVEACSEVGFWSAKCRGPDALKAELKKCQALCRFHHALQTQQRSNETKDPWVLRKRAIINTEKHKRGCCLRCDRVLKKGEECAFDFDHRNSKTKFKYNAKRKSPAAFVNFPDAVFAIQWPLEQAKCDLLCVNCHKLKDNRDGYKKTKSLKDHKTVYTDAFTEVICT